MKHFLIICHIFNYKKHKKMFPGDNCVLKCFIESIFKLEKVNIAREL